MKNFIIQSLTLTVIVVMVYAATIKPPHQTHDDNKRKLIRDQANKMLKEGHLNNTNYLVPKISDEEKTCRTDFFCLAEKSLRKNETKEENSIKHLIHLLHQYNKNHTLHCNLTTNTSYHIVQLLVAISNCATK